MSRKRRTNNTFKEDVRKEHPQNVNQDNIKTRNVMPENYNISVPPQVQQPVQQHPIDINPLLERASLPGETFSLPSMGIFYNNGELANDVVNGEILIYPMVTMDEIIMKTPDKLLNGTAITEVLRRCAPQILKPLEILGKDMDFILVALRKITYGNGYEVVFTHDCENAKEHSYIVDIDKWLRSNRKIDTSIMKNECIVTFPNNQVCSIIPPKYGQIIKLFKNFEYQADMEGEISEREAAKQFIDSVLSLIDNVDGIVDRKHIEEWLTAIPAGYLKQISDRISKITNWGIDNEVEEICKDCKQPMKMNISLNPVSFFI